MVMKSKRILLPALLLGIALLLCGCRVRTGESTEIISADDAESRTEAKQGESISADALPNEIQDSGEPGGQTRENPASSRKEYDENAPAEIEPGTDRLLHKAGEGNGASAAKEESGTTASQVNDLADETAVQTTAAENAAQMGVSEDADAADSAMTYFNVLLQDKMGSLFECQRLNVYWETARDHVTIHRRSPEHALILNAGCYDVSARLLAENLLVDDGWVVRKNPGVIVRIADSTVLGSGISSSGAAKALYESLRNREGWAAIDAVKNKRILLLSEELLEAPHLQTAAMVMIAKTANPALFTDVDPDTMLQMLMEEAAGTFSPGIFYYKED